MLYRSEKLFADNGCVVLLHNAPILFAAQLHLFDLIVGCSALALHQRSDIDGIFQNGPHRDGRPRVVITNCLKSGLIFQPLPLFICCRRQNALRGEIIGNSLLAVALHFQLKDGADHHSGIFVDDKLVLVGRVFQIAITGKGTEKFSRLALDTKLRPKLLGKAAAVRLVHDVFDGDGNIIAQWCVFTVQIIIDGDEPDAHIRKNGFQILAGLDILTAKAGQVFYNDAVCLLFTDGIHNAAKAGAVIVGASITVVYLLPHQRDLRVSLYELINQLPLVVDTLALIALAQL